MASSLILLQSQLRCILSPRCYYISSPGLFANCSSRVFIGPPTSSDCNCKKRDKCNSRGFTVSFAFTDGPKSDYSPQSVDIDDLQDSLRQLADTFVLPEDYFNKLPRDLRLDLNDAAFDLSNGSVIDECGQELGEILLNISRAWELADTSTSSNFISKLPSLVDSLTVRQKSALGKRLVSSGRRFQSTGQYGQGELQKIAQAMTMTGKLLTSSISSITDDQPKESTRVLKFGDLQVEITPGKAYIGATIGFIFGIICWQVTKGIQSIPENSLEYANDNALLLAKSLRGALLALFYSSTFLSGLAGVGLILLATQLKKEKE